MKIRPISDAEVAKMMSEETLLFKKHGVSFPISAFRKGPIHDMVMQANLPFDDQKKFWKIITDNDILPVLKLIDDMGGNLVAVLRVNANGEEAWYKTFDAIQEAFGNCFFDEFRSPNVYASLHDANPVTGKMPEIIYSMSEAKQRATEGFEFTPDDVFMGAGLFMHLREMATSEGKEG